MYTEGLQTPVTWTQVSVLWGVLCVFVAVLGWRALRNASGPRS